MSAGEPFEFCTLFDHRYLARGLALYRSLERHCDDFRLRVLCLDQRTEELLRRIDADRLETISLAELEAHDRDLRTARDTRSRVEYYWTCHPSLCRYVLAREPELQMITGLDADLMFFSSPAPLFAELGGASVLVVPHRWAPEHSDCEIADTTSQEAWGVYNVAFETFRQDGNGIAALSWWRDRCLEACPALARPGYFGDQKYLDDWPQRFPGVHVLHHLGGGLAPWNVGQYRLERHGPDIVVDGQPLIFHHYQALWLHQASALGRAISAWSSRYRRCQTPQNWVWGTRWRLSGEVLDLLWDPYIEQLAAAATELIDAGAQEDIGTEPFTARVATGRFIRRHLPKKMRRTYWQARRAWREPVRSPITLTGST